MSNNNKGNITSLLKEARDGSQEAYEKLFNLLYDELKTIALCQLKQIPVDTLSKTDLVHEVYLKLTNSQGLDCENRTHFFALTARAMRFFLIDYARKKQAKKRGGDWEKVTYIDELWKIRHKAKELLELDQALNRLASLNERLVKVVELRYFANLSIKDTAEVMGLSPRTVTRDWAKARGWLYKELKKEVYPAKR